MIPPLILQPLVENSIKHGVSKKKGGGSILVSTWEEDGHIMIGIDDDEIVYVPVAKAIKNDKPIDRELVNVLHALSI